MKQKIEMRIIYYTELEGMQEITSSNLIVENGYEDFLDSLKDITQYISMEQNVLIEVGGKEIVIDGLREAFDTYNRLAAMNTTSVYDDVYSAIADVKQKGLLLEGNTGLSEEDENNLLSHLVDFYDYKTNVSLNDNTYLSVLDIGTVITEERI